MIEVHSIIVTDTLALAFISLSDVNFVDANLPVTGFWNPAGPFIRARSDRSIAGLPLWFRARVHNS